VPHAENLTYFGNGKNEAQLILQLCTAHRLSCILFARLMPPSFQNGRAGLKCLTDPSHFLQFSGLARWDRIEFLRGNLSPDDTAALVKQTLTHGGLISYRHTTDGRQSPYELNINYFDALSDPAGDEPLALQVDRFMAAQAIMLSLRGLPGIYFH